MKVAYVLNTPNAANYKVGEMILPQLESDSHGVDVVGIFFLMIIQCFFKKETLKAKGLQKLLKKKDYHIQRSNKMQRYDLILDLVTVLYHL